MMLKGNIRDIAPDQAMLKYFEGQVEIKKMVTDATSKEAEAYLVTFLRGARTKLHYHETDQILIATKGKGIVALQTKVEMENDNVARVRLDEVHHLEEGDFVCVPAYAWHWHGAQKGEDFAHIQVKKPGKTTWLE
ncbi:cupin domain-containing protein [Nitrososphaera viennensis]|nr:cupin domain-containing protein [Nitrososphaera viennensis]UVS70300.1 cupin domain-containing protein [Nitrososphaera viennensis]